MFGFWPFNGLINTGRVRKLQLLAGAMLAEELAAMTRHEFKITHRKLEFGFGRKSEAEVVGEWTDTVHDHPADTVVDTTVKRITVAVRASRSQVEFVVIGHGERTRATRGTLDTENRDYHLVDGYQFGATRGPLTSGHLPRSLRGGISRMTDGLLELQVPWTEKASKPTPIREDVAVEDDDMVANGY